MPFQLNTAKLFLTYPQCNLDKELLLQELIVLLPPINEYIIAKEKHSNGDFHLHAFLSLTESFRTRSANCLDILVNGNRYHGNYQGCRSEKNVLKYCSKEEDYISNFDVGARIDRVKSHKKKIAQSLLDKRITLVDLVKENPELLFDYKKIKSNLEEFFADAGDTRCKLPDFLPNTWGILLPTNIQGKRRHYWIYSREPNKGKTTHAKNWNISFKLHIQCGDMRYWRLDGDEECILLDDYNTGTLTYSWLNQMCDGTICYPVFQRGNKKLIDPLIIVFSNKRICDIYINMFNLLYERFNEIELV